MHVFAILFIIGGATAEVHDAQHDLSNLQLLVPLSRPNPPYVPKPVERDSYDLTNVEGLLGQRVGALGLHGAATAAGAGLANHSPELTVLVVPDKEDNEQLTPQPQRSPPSLPELRQACASAVGRLPTALVLQTCRVYLAALIHQYQHHTKHHNQSQYHTHDHANHNQPQHHKHDHDYVDHNQPQYHTYDHDQVDYKQLQHHTQDLADHNQPEHHTHDLADHNQPQYHTHEHDHADHNQPQHHKHDHDYVDHNQPHYHTYDHDHADHNQPQHHKHDHDYVDHNQPHYHTYDHADHNQPQYHTYDHADHPGHIGCRICALLQQIAPRGSHVRFIGPLDGRRQAELLTEEYPGIMSRLLKAAKANRFKMHMERD